MTIVGIRLIYNDEMLLCPEQTRDLSTNATSRSIRMDTDK
jgi:hypothetical protein